MRAIVHLSILLLLMAVAASSSAQDTHVQVAVNRLEQGNALRLVGQDSRVVTGLLESTTGSSLTIATEEGMREMPFSDVRRISRRGDRVWDGLVIGAAFGAVIGASGFTPCHADFDEGLCYGNFTSTRGGDALVGAVGFGLVGLAVDLLHQGWTTVYRQRDATSARLSAVLSHKRASLAVNMRF